MSASELSWRVISMFRDAELWGRLTLGLEPKPDRYRPARTRR